MSELYERFYDAVVDGCRTTQTVLNADCETSQQEIEYMIVHLTPNQFKQLAPNTYQKLLPPNTQNPTPNDDEPSIKILGSILRSINGKPVEPENHHVKFIQVVLGHTRFSAKVIEDSESEALKEFCNKYYQLKTI